MSQLPQCSHTRRSIKCCILMTHDAKGEKGRARSQEAEHTPEANLALLPKFVRIDSLLAKANILILGQVYHSVRQVVDHNALMNRFAQR